MSEVSTTYKGVEIAYHEDDNKWRYELHGKERSAETLTNAKKSIDTQPKEKTDFTPQQALLINYRGMQVVTVTSVADPGKYARNIVEYWVKSKEGRTKEYATKLFATGPANEQIFREAQALDLEATSLENKANAKRKEMAPFTPKS